METRAIEDIINDGPNVLANDSPTKVLASECLNNAAGHLSNRASTYDSPQGERSMLRTVQTFHSFMSILKMVRSQQGNFKLDNYEDGAAYFALAAEAAASDRS